MKLFVGIPARDGRICAATAISLLQEQALALEAGVGLQFGIVPGCSVLHIARDQVVRDFLKSDGDKLVFVDDDVSWEAGSLLKLASHRVELAGGAYRFKRAVEDYPVQWLPKPELWADPETGLLEVLTLPGGFLCIARSVFERMRAAHPERSYSHMGERLHGFFHAPIGASEDTQFCLEWREIGGKVWLDPELRLDHHGGVATFEGHIGNWLRGRC